ncbi:MAG TPA: membrane protein insertion efficiency factor YidD [Patescibacteria group bacterium]|nr:membrane protein insertion efficiency factor YidD [Patescibacteria group bacterium]
MKKILLSLIRFYQKSAFFHAYFLCRFTPTCSHYTYEAIEKYGVCKGLRFGLKRIIHCHPFSKGEYDPVK